MNPLLKPFALKKPIKKAKSPRTKIRRRTKSRAKDEAIYRKRVKEWLKFRIFCRWSNCIAPATECHHKFGRRGKLLLWEDGWVALCAEHHFLTHSNPRIARENLITGEVGQFNNQSLAK